MRTGNTAIVAGALALLASAPGHAQVRIDVPVMIGGSADQDACPSSGVITGLNPRGDGFLSVRSGPAGSYAEMDRLYNGNPVQICSDSGSWMAIVYGGDGGQCGVSRALPRRLAYTGPCRYGWVSARYVSVTAG
jgi:hypothetical protein